MKDLDPSEDPDTANFTTASPGKSMGQPCSDLLLPTREAESAIRKCFVNVTRSDEPMNAARLTTMQGFPIGDTAPVHNAGFRETALIDFSEDQAVATAKILALTGLEVLGDETRKGYQCDMIDEDLKGS
ncbi:hypothetical protein NLU13_5052 [Sarocladium strictum]|uniref:Uncharacterized protein n=1 Tax=Sarocladium strictum TaxID=5046 RepID=A0AA39GLT6_SARSR|nr:hypothetical protein NLU13_5052 [Sarocladium strictum]